MRPSAAYHSYLLRIRRVQDRAPHHSEGAWRFSLESPDGQERHTFTSLRGLAAFLAFLVEPDGPGSG